MKRLAGLSAGAMPDASIFPRTGPTSDSVAADPDLG